MQAAAAALSPIIVALIAPAGALSDIWQANVTAQMQPCQLKLQLDVTSFHLRTGSHFCTTQLQLLFKREDSFFLAAVDVNIFFFYTWRTVWALQLYAFEDYLNLYPSTRIFPKKKCAQPVSSVQLERKKDLTG